MAEEKKQSKPPHPQQQPKKKKEGKGDGAPPKPEGKVKKQAPAEPAPSPRLRDRFRGAVSDKIKEEFGVTNVMALPRIDKIVITVGLGKQLDGTKLNPKAKEQVLKDLNVITGQRPVVTLAKKSVANFKVRAGFEIGARVTLRGARMWEFFDRLVSIAIPRIKDFRGLNPKSFDGRGNYSIGVTEQAIFPEVNMAESEFSHGMNITFVFRNSDDIKSRAVLRELGMPFSKPEDRRGGGGRNN